MTALVRHVIDEPVPIIDGRITIMLPEYDLEIEAPVKRINTGHGATYAKDWEELPPKCGLIIKTWYNDANWRNTAWEKNDLRALMANNAIQYTPASFLARISELVGAGFVKISEPEIKDEPHNTTKAPRYSLNMDIVKDWIMERGYYEK